ncbi:MAG: hypothetical protein OXI54_16370 [Chloroflexota bacterium]|nr:hypothetical protein [Chloroflexota bacterium]MDE2685703.1 hypothetical protein [Chloroflexota bacterium]
MSESKLEAIVSQVRNTIKLGLSTNELHTRYTAIDPLIRALGWDTEDPFQVRVEYLSRAGARIDYALFNRAGQAAILIEAKDICRDPGRSGRQLANYLSKFHGRGESPSVGVLTNGRHWNLYDLKAYGAAVNQPRQTIDVCAGEAWYRARELSQELGKHRWW